MPAAHAPPTPPARTDDTSLVTLNNVTAGYGRQASALEDVDITIARGDFLGVVGPSGSGKTTLLRVIAGAHRPRHGTVARAPRLTIGFVPQVEMVNWNFPATALEIALMARIDRRTPWINATTRAEATTVFARLGLEGMERRGLASLSGGQQQRVFIARALLCHAQLLLLDEPTAGIDVRSRHDVLHLLDELHTAGLTIVLTTHDLNTVAAHLPSLVCLNRRVIAHGAPETVLTPEALQQTYGAPMEVLTHAGMPLVIDRRQL